MLSTSVLAGFVLQIDFQKMIRIISLKKKCFASALVPFHMLIKYTPKSNLRERVCLGSYPTGIVRRREDISVTEYGVADHSVCTVET